MMLRAIQLVLAFVSTTIAARILGVEGRGAYALALTLSTVVFVLVHMSVEHAAGRLIARRESTMVDTSRALALLCGAFGILGFGVTLGAAVVIGGSPYDDTLLIVLAAAGLLPRFVAVFAAALLFRMAATTVWGVVAIVVETVIVGGTILVATVAELTPTSMMAVILVSNVVSAALLTSQVAARLGGVALVPGSPSVAWRLLKFGVAVHATSIAFYLNLKIDILLVGAIAGEADAGIYGLSVQFADAMFVATSSVYVAGLHRQTWLTESEAIDYTVDLTSRSLTATIALSVAAGLLIYPFLAIVFGSAWTPAALPFIILLFAALARSVEDPHRSLLIRIDHPAPVAIASVVALIANILLNIPLISWLGPPGAALASVVSYGIAATFMLMLTARYRSARVRSILPRPSLRALSPLRSSLGPLRGARGPNA